MPFRWAYCCSCCWRLRNATLASSCATASQQEHAQCTTPVGSAQTMHRLCVCAAHALQYALSCTIARAWRNISVQLNAVRWVCCLGGPITANMQFTSTRTLPVSHALTAPLRPFSSAARASCSSRSVRSSSVSSLVTLCRIRVQACQGGIAPRRCSSLQG